MAITVIITDAGRNALVDAQHDGTNHVTVAQMGVSDQPLAATQATAALPGEIKRLNTVAGVVVAGDTIHVTVQDASTDSYNLCSFALYLDDGTLFAVYGQPGAIIQKSTQAILLMAVDIVVSDIDAASVTFGSTDFVIPPATTQNMGVVQLADIPTTQAGTNPTLVVTVAGLLAAFVLWLSSYGVWRSSNDGSGSGLDADLLDGQEGAYYSNVTARLGYTPANRAGDNLSGNLYQNGNLFWNAGNDGAGSGADADLLDGQDGSFYSNVVGRLGYTPVNRAGDNLSGNLYQNSNIFWNAGNDGAGSGSDADLLDGHDGSFYLDLTNATVNVVSNANGVAITIGKLVIQVGQAQTVAADTTNAIVFPVVQTNAPVWAIAGQHRGAFNKDQDAYGEVIGAPSNAGMTVANNNVSGDPVIDIPWAAIFLKP